MEICPLDCAYLQRVLLELLAIPSPSGYTDRIVHYVADELNQLGIEFELTRRGAIRATIPGDHDGPDRAIVAHLDTLGAIVTQIKPNARLAVCPVGNWSSRFAEGARVTIFTDQEGAHRGTIVPLKASGHIFDDEIDKQPVAWDNVEVRVDERAATPDDLQQLGINIGDWIAVDPQPEITEAGYVVSRHLDDKAGVATVLAAARAVVQSGKNLPLDCHILFTIFEEVGSGASAILHGDVAEMIAVDNATPGPGQNSTEQDIVIAMKDSAGPFDYHLTHQLIHLAREHGLPLRRDVFRHYRCDAASAVEAGNDIRTALVCFGVDASHGYERTHLDGLCRLGELLSLYMQSPLTIQRDRMELGPIKGFPDQPM